MNFKPLAAAAVFALTGLFQTVQADPQNIKILVGFPPGGGTDAIARVLADKLREPLAANVVVENREIGRAHV